MQLITHSSIINKIFTDLFLFKYILNYTSCVEMFSTYSTSKNRTIRIFIGKASWSFTASPHIKLYQQNVCITSYFLSVSLIQFFLMCKQDTYSKITLSCLKKQIFIFCINIYMQHIELRKIASAKYKKLMKGVHWPNHVSNEELHQKTGQLNILYTIAQSCVHWLGHILQ